jgi:hypothetical protein
MGGERARPVPKRGRAERKEEKAVAQAGSLLDFPDVECSGFAPVSEDELAEQRRREGNRVVERRGRYWLEVSPGFYDGIHWLARHRPEDIGRPAALCWGYRAALAESAGGLPNATLPVHLLSGVRDYGLDSISSHYVRRDLKRFPKRGIRIVRLTDPRVLEEQGYAVMMSSRRRTGRREPAPSPSKYRDLAQQRLREPGWILLAGLTGDRLLGYQAAWAVGRTAYLHEHHVLTEAMNTKLSAALYFAAVRAFQRCQAIDEICAGLGMPEKEGLTTFKLRLGFDLVGVPSRVWMLPPAGALLRRFRPFKYYRLTGHGPPGRYEGDPDAST